MNYYYYFMSIIIIKMNDEFIYIMNNESAALRLAPFRTSCRQIPCTRRRATVRLLCGPG